ncbi:MAG TPA: phospholipid carrier-dependent glycosyltransferase [Burkholderiales bacterium]|nr:phospholipid carrier-dependent glycosyltransferase [Burkholderiales bacterium]
MKLDESLHRNDPQEKSGATHIGRWYLAGLFVLALGLRCVGLEWGGRHPDENIGDAARALTGELVPLQPFYPPLLNYLTAAGDVLLFLIGLPAGLWSNLTGFRDAYFETPEIFLLVLRLVVSVTGALAAPLSAMIAGRLALSRAGCLAVGVAMALLPLSVWRSHIGKPDLGVAASALLAIWAMLRYAQELRRADAAWMGIAFALAISFKHSALFIFAPFCLAVLVMARQSGQTWPRLMRDALVAFGVGLAVWVPANVGLWLDLSNFLDYQKVQAAMSERDSGILLTAATVSALLSNTFAGPTFPLLVAFLGAPLCWRRLDVLAIWTSVIASIVAVAAITGERAPIQLYVPQSVLIAGIGMITWVALAQRTGPIRRLGMTGMIVTAIVLGMGTFDVVRQALLPDIRSRVSQVLLGIEGIAHRRIMISEVQYAGLPVSGDAERDERARHERLALQYGVNLPPRRRPYAPVEGRYYIRRFPSVMGGLEIYEEKDVKLVKPFTWPLQPTEWKLDYWLDQGYSVFVVLNEERVLKSKVDAYRLFHEEIRDRGVLLATVEANRTLFQESSAKVYLVDPAAKTGK